MSNSWEVTENDVLQVLIAHHCCSDVETIFDMIDVDEVEDAALQHNDIENQQSAALSEIEDQLIDAKVVFPPKKFV
jgi:hypothetical protein